jgi:phenylacetate-CoA ligase
MLDVFRGEFGYKTGVKTAWFSGKHLLTAKDVKKNRFWKTDNYYNVRYYSTFHVKEEYLKHYLDNLIQYKPEFLVGFPSTIADIARYGLKHNVVFPENIIKGVFPTAETITEEIRTLIETFFKTNLYNQYASSEGAPFIFECKNKKLHLELQSGVFEVLDDNNQPTDEGRLILTSFTTEGTPLIRYDIGDRLKMSNAICSCGNNNPMVEKILGRIDDYIFSPENGKINLGNVSNTLKDTYGIVRFQAIQDTLDSIVVKLVTDKKIYTQDVEKKFLQNWKDRVGNNMEIILDYVDDIPVEKSGKFRFVKNNIKHLLT